MAMYLRQPTRTPLASLADDQVQPDLFQRVEERGWGRSQWKEEAGSLV